jgi:hypothetical protein
MGTTMGEVEGDKPRSKGRRLTVARGNAVKDAVPDVQPPGGILEARKRKEVPAESDEEDD